MDSRPTSPPQTVTPALLGSAQRAIAADELRTNRIRVATAYTLAVILIPTFAVTDFISEALWPDETDLGTSLLVRVVAILCTGGVLLRLKTAAVTERELDFWVNLLCPAMVVIVALLSLCMSGVHSPYMVAICLVTAGYAFVPRRWTKVVGSGLAAVVLLPATFWIAALVWDRARIEMALPRRWFDLVVGDLVLAANITALAAAAHLLWVLRRDVFAARTIGRYRTKALIGKGGMGEVWSAYDETLRRNVALKVLRIDAPDPAALARFEREVQATTELTHPNTVRVLDFGVTDEGLSYYAMELLDGESLSAVLHREGPLVPARAVHFALQAARALSEAHARRIVHRDVKPENLFITCAGGEPDFLRVLDFGIARVDRGDAATHLTQTGTFAGTPLYLAPEVITGTEDVGAPVDVYALGVVLYQMLSGQFPYGDVKGPKVLLAHVLEPVVPLSTYGEIDPELAAIVERCLEKRAVDRYPDAGALAEALAELPIANTWHPRRMTTPSVAMRDQSTNPQIDRRLELPTVVESVIATAVSTNGRE